MSYSKEDFDTMMRNKLKRGDTFGFECKMCGRCCRNRSEPILLTGTDVFRIAVALQMTPRDVLLKYTNADIGESSHVPIIYLKERLDGSCRLMKNGRCSVQKSKPIVCALYPLGRIWNVKEERFYYFSNGDMCPGSWKPKKRWTLQEWLDEFDIEKTESWTIEWNKLLGDIALITAQMDISRIDDAIAGYLTDIMYVSYDIDKPYIEQVRENRERFKNDYRRFLSKK